MIRLLQLQKNGGFNLVERSGSDIPRYAILSHTWGNKEDEVTFKDLSEGTGKNKKGYQKLVFCARQAAADRLRFFWVDTCCIDKSSSAELTEAINSMFAWYQKSAKCYVYLTDVSTRGLGHEVAFHRSRWFTRGWTLQELLAPKSVNFFSAEGDFLGNKRSLVSQITDITGISLTALMGIPLRSFPVKERMSWMDRRETGREEDMAYSLMGIFDINMTLIYGEGKVKALRRLEEEIKKYYEHKKKTPSRKIETRPQAQANRPRQNSRTKEISEAKWERIKRTRWSNYWCLNCGSNDHKQVECKENCGKCDHSGHKATKCRFPVRCMKCRKQNHFSEDCPESVPQSSQQHMQMVQRIYFSYN